MPVAVQIPCTGRVVGDSALLTTMFCSFKNGRPDFGFPISGVEFVIYGQGSSFLTSSFIYVNAASIPLFAPSLYP